MMLTQRTFLIFFVWIVLAASYNFSLPLHPDEAYYWQWSRHLALSYYDGPPLMAYLIRIITMLVGSTAFGVKLTAVILTSIGVYFIYRLSCIIFNERIAHVALLITITSPLIQANYLASTLDPALFCFWSMTLYYFYIAILKNSIKYRYVTSISFGLTMLAKYPGVLLGVALFMYLLISKQYRKELKNIHWYLGIIIALLIFSPVLIWNWQHDFVGFIYQYNHGIAKEKIFQWELMMLFIVGQVGAANPLCFIGTFYFCLRYWKEIYQNEKLLFLATPFLVTFSFFFYEGLFKHSEVNWPACAYISSSILLAYYIVQHKKKILYGLILILNIVLAIVLRFPNLTPFLPNQAILIRPFFGYHELMEQANAAYHPGDIIISNSYQIASEAAFYLKGQPQSYILNDTREYQYWSQPIIQQIKEGKIKSALFIGPADTIDQVPLFTHKVLIKQLQYSNSWVQRTLSLYRVYL